MKTMAGTSSTPLHRMKRCEELVRILSPFFDNLHNLETKLKCPVCTNLFEEPKLLPCDHTICCNCLPTGQTLACPKCSKMFCSKDARGSLYVEKMVMVFNDVDDAISDLIKESISYNAPVDKDTETNAIPPDSKERRFVLVTNSSCKNAEAVNVASAPNDLCNKEQTDERGAIHSKSCASEFPVSQRSHTSLTSNSCEIVGTKDAVSGASSSCEIVGTKNVVSAAKDSFKKEEIETDGGTSGGKTSSTGATKSAKKREDKTTIGIVGGSKRRNLGEALKFQTTQREITFRSTPINLFDDECAFCHSFRTTELYGSMVCYLNGILVKPEEVDQEKVIHVHEKCLVWAPNVYYSGDNVINLEKEIERGEQLICCKCGVKGAVLGCFYGPCRRSYHATCALEIDCRWDSENFNMLCPAHASEKLKRDDSLLMPDRNNEDT